MSWGYFIMWHVVYGLLWFLGKIRFEKFVTRFCHQFQLSCSKKPVIFACEKLILLISLNFICFFDFFDIFTLLIG